MATTPENHNAPPEWFNNSFIESALKRSLKLDDSELVKIDIKMATAPGDHYASSLFRCQLKIKSKQTGDGDQSKSVIVKVIPSGVMGEELRKFSAFEREAHVLTVVSPALEEILKKSYPDEDCLAPLCYHYEGSPQNLIIMEDLKVSNFQIANRIEGLDMDHAALVLRGLAKFHASSIILLQKYPDMFEMYKTPVWCRKNSDMMNQFLGSTFSALIEDILTWEKFEEREVVYHKLRAMQEGLVDKVLDAIDPDNARLKVLLHGDSWVNNFMFRYDSSGKPVQMKFVDFQLSCLNTPVVDLQYFIYSSIKEDIKFDLVDTFLQIYHDSFHETLHRSDFQLEPSYGLGELKEDFNSMFMWGLIVFCCIFPLFKVPSGETMSPDELIQAEKRSFLDIFKREDLRKSLAKGLLYFVEKGVL